MLDQLTQRKLIEFAVTTEELGGAFYNRMARKFADDADVGPVFAQLGKDEQTHREQFAKLLGSVPASYDDQVDYERAQYLRAMAISEFFSPAHGPLAKADQVTDAGQALAYALKLEKATLAYYQAMRDELADASALESIIAAEKQHLVRLMKVITTGARFRGLQDDWP
jgi:rubrerythrin